MTRAIAVPIKPGTPEWLDWRRGGYGSSDVSTLLSGDEKAWRLLHMVKLGLLDDADATEPMEWGKDLEPAIARAYAKRTGEPVQKVPPLVHAELPVVRASLDRRRRRGHVAVELKAWGFKTNDFGADGSDQVPEGMYSQVQQQLAVTGWDQADIAVLFGSTKRLEVYRIGRDGTLIDTLLSIETAAYAYVERGEMPPWPGPAETRPDLKVDEIPADDELMELVAAHELAARTVDDDEALLTAVKNRLRMRLTEAGGTRGELPDGRRFSVTHRPEKPRTSTAWQHVAAGYRKRLEALGVPAEVLDFPITALTTPEAPRRPLRVSIAEPREETAADAA